jgi:protein import protein ZIM17
VQCPGCKNRHLIADHLKVFGDKSVTLEQILAEKGDLLKKGGLGVEGDMELWDEKTDGEVKAIG